MKLSCHLRFFLFPIFFFLFLFLVLHNFRLRSIRADVHAINVIFRNRRKRLFVDGIVDRWFFLFPFNIVRCEEEDKNKVRKKRVDRSNNRVYCAPKCHFQDCVPRESIVNN